MFRDRIHEAKVNDIVNRVGDHIYRTRMQQGKTQEDISRETQQSLAGFANIERARVRNPGIFTIEKILNSLGYTLKIAKLETDEKKK